MTGVIHKEKLIFLLFELHFALRYPKGKKALLGKLPPYKTA